MPLIHWYIGRRILTLFPAGLLVLTAIIWATQALQRLDIVTAKGQAITVFLELTLATVPFLATVLAPIAFVIAMVAIYDAANRDSELVVIGAAGGGRRTLIMPALYAAAVCSAIVAVGAFYLGPLGLAKARTLITEVRADVVASIVQPGRFITIEDGLTVHIRDRTADGFLDGLLLDDRRDAELAMTYVAEQARVVEAEGNTLLIMQNGTVQRMERPADELTVVAFDVYGFDLTELTDANAVTRFRPSERTLWDLLSPDPDDTYRAGREDRFAVELHDRLSQPLLPFVYALVVFLFVGDPRMHRQSRFAGIVAAGVAVAAIRGATYGVLLAASSVPWVALLVYPLLLAFAAIAMGFIVTDRTITLHEQAGAALKKTLDRLAELRVGQGQAA